MIIQKVGIIGAGTMGNGIAQTCAVSGLKVVMVDIAQAALAAGSMGPGSLLVHLQDERNRAAIDLKVQVMSS